MSFLPRILVRCFFILCAVLGVAILLTLLTDIATPSLISNIKLLDDPFLLDVTKNTVQLYSISIFIQILIAFIVTSYFNHISNWLKPLLIAPYALGVVAPAFAMYVLFSSAIGPFNYNILGDPVSAMFVVALIDTWQWLGVLLLLSFFALEKIPKTYHEQAQLDKISRINRWRLIAFPQLKLIFSFYAIFRLIDWIRKVDIVKVLFGTGGPGGSQETIGLYIITKHYMSNTKGYSAILSIIQLVILISFVILLTRLPMKVLNDEY